MDNCQSSLKAKTHNFDTVISVLIMVVEIFVSKIYGCLAGLNLLTVLSIAYDFHHFYWSI